ncbi:alpha/beta hydrolase [Brevibacillus choshinensis]|uniref:alpha/beta fold hydrolase n=1 Tax=Brevibacillus choshinensis TaxID=54911 RepID=UPI002E1A76F9|nr:alpha/beta hydrolase [Brevibacillus choshinensis]MED4779609.1 alpha/beta hydrolase [Brevibacillus choshinensis]
MKNRMLHYLLLALFTFFISGNTTVSAMENKAFTEPIQGKNSIATLEKVMIAGNEQWITVRGEDKNNPILLYLHGGPGHAEMNSNPRFRLLEKRFVVVNWDQRGSGKSFSPHLNKETLHVERYLADTHEMVELLKKRFGREKIYLAGHSWGSLLGMMEVKRNPESFYAYIGIGQFVDVTRGDKIGYEYTLNKAKEVGNQQAIRELQGIGAPPYDSLATFMQYRKWIVQLGGVFYSPTYIQDIMIPDIQKATEYTDDEKKNYEVGEVILTTTILPELPKYNLLEMIDQVEVPVYFITGRYDYNTPYELVEQLYNKMKAPHKEIIWFEKSGHAPNYEEEQKFAEVMNEHIFSQTYPSSGKH